MTSEPARTSRDAPAASRGRGRPRTSQTQIKERRREIVAAAYEVFTQKGYHAAGIADIAEHLGIGHGTVYRYFDNKREILDHVLDLGIEQVLGGVSVDLLAEAETVEELRHQMTTVGEQLFEHFMDRNPDLPRMVLLEVGAIDHELTVRVLGLIDMVSGLLTPLFENGVRREFLPADLDARANAQALVGCVISGLMTNLRSPMTPEERSTYIDSVVSLFCDRAVS